MIIDRSIGSIGSMIVGLRRLWKERAKGKKGGKRGGGEEGGIADPMGKLLSNDNRWVTR